MGYMSQRLKRILIILNVFFFVCLVATILIPTATPKVEISNTDTSTTITKIGAITNSRNIQLEFELYNEDPNCSSAPLTVPSLDSYMKAKKIKRTYLAIISF